MAVVFVIVSIALVWAVLLAAAYLVRLKARGRGSAVAIVTGGYLVVAAASFGWFGLNRIGALGATGMLLPYAVSLGLALLPR